MNRSRGIGAISIVIGTLLYVSHAAADSKPPEKKPSSKRYTISKDTLLDTKTKLIWQRATSDKKYNWQDAQSYCQNLKLGGLSSGWRLPTKEELLSIVDKSSSQRSIVLHFRILRIGTGRRLLLLMVVNPHGSSILTPKTPMSMVATPAATLRPSRFGYAALVDDNACSLVPIKIEKLAWKLSAKANIFLKAMSSTSLKTPCGTRQALMLNSPITVKSKVRPVLPIRLSPRRAAQSSTASVLVFC